MYGEEFMNLHVAAGESLADALRKRRLYVDMPCGGNGTCGRCRVLIENIGWVKSCQFRQPGDYKVQLPAARDFHAVVFQDKGTQDARADRKIHESLQIQQGRKRPLVVMDLGTTTVVMGIFYQEKEQISTFTNPQRIYGADVMSRIQKAAEGKGKELQKLLLEQIAQMLGQAWKEWRLADCKTADFVVSANTAMQHLMEGLPCKGLGVSPFQPVDISLHEYRLLWDYQSTQGAITDQEENKNRIEPEGCPWKLHITSLPGISTFIGADIVSGIYALSIMEEEQPVLLLDLGTNGEMVLGCKDKLLAASAAAGPAFEGSELALAIHGAGVMKLLHQMLDEHVLDETGLLADEYFDMGYPVVWQSGTASPLTSDNNMPAGIQRKENAIKITQEDIRQIQMAKAAVCAGIRILLNEYGILPQEVAKVYLAGGMGYYLDPEDAIAIGLLPKEFAQKTKAAGNTSYQGALLYAQNPETGNQKMKQIVDAVQEVVLSGHPLFEDCYMEAINFPEADRRVGFL